MMVERHMPCRVDLSGKINVGDTLAVFIMEDFLISGSSLHIKTP
jgi:hypothetical protein